MNTEERITVIGAGHGGKAMSAHLAIMGAKVTLYNRTWKNIQLINERGGISLKGEMGEYGFGEMALVTSDIERAVKASRLIMVVVPAFAHASVAARIAPYLEDDQIVVLNPGRTFGSFEFRQVLNECGSTSDAIVAETQTFIYASRSEGPTQAYIHRIKDSIPLAALPALHTRRVLEVLKPYYPQFVDGKTVLHTGLDNIGAIFHPTITLHNAGWIEASGGEFQFYLDGVTPSISRVMEAIDRERVRIGAALGVELMTALEWLKLAYDSTGENLLESIHNQQGYRGIKAPSTINHRYVNEDIPMSLVPLASIGRMLGVRVRGMESLIRLACIIRKKDYWESGRTVERLGIDHLSPDELRMVAEGTASQSLLTRDACLKYIPFRFYEESPPAF